MSDTEREVFDYLANAEHIEAAFDLYTIMPRVINGFHQKFWEKLMEEVQRKLGDRGITGWEASFSSTDASDCLNDAYFTFQIAPPQDDKDLRTYCSFFIQQAYDPDGRKKHREDSMRHAELRYGIGIEPGVGEKQQKKLPAEVAKLWQSMKDWDLYGRERQLEDGTIAVRRLGYSIRARNEVIRLAQPGDTLEKEIADKLFELFEEKRDVVIKCNLALKTWKAS
jgi:hypothetical protein